MTIKKIRKSWEFDLIFRTGIRVNGELVRLLYLKTEDQNVRVGYAVGKRQGKAHVRNRGRRILREAFRHIAPEIAPGISLMLGLRNRGLDSKSGEIAQELSKILNRKKLLTQKV